MNENEIDMMHRLRNEIAGEVRKIQRLLMLIAVLAASMVFIGYLIWASRSPIIPTYWI